MSDGGVVDVALYGIYKELDDYLAVVGEALYGRFDGHGDLWSVEGCPCPGLPAEGEGVLCVCGESPYGSSNVHTVYYYADRTDMSRDNLGNFVGNFGEKGILVDGFSAKGRRAQGGWGNC